MPFPLPWFDNKVDPLLPQPQNIKPLLYAYDDYQTYDLLWYIPAQQALWGFLLRQFGVNFPVSAPNRPDFFWMNHYSDSFLISEPAGITLFERFTPWNYAWAENYSTKFFNFIKQYCITVQNWFLSYDEIWSTSVDYQKDTLKFKYFPNLPVLQLSTTDEYVVSQKFTFVFDAPKPQTIVLTWLEYQGIEVSKRYQIFNFQKGENQITLLFPGYFCACSMVISGDDLADIETAINNVNLGILFKNLDKLFEEISDRVRWITGIYTYAGGGTTVRKPMPKWAYWAKLIYANNNYWGNQINLDITQDLGKPIFFTPVDKNGSIVDLKCYLWGNYLYAAYHNDLNKDPFNGALGLFRTSVHKSIIFTENSIEYSIFTEGEQEALNQQLENFLISKFIAIPQNVVIDFLDAKKKLELLDA